MTEQAVEVPEWTAQDQSRMEWLSDYLENLFTSEKPTETVAELEALRQKRNTWRAAQKRFIHTRLVDDFEDEQAKTKILDLTIRKMTEEIMAHPEYPGMRDRVLRSGHRLRTDLSLEDFGRFRTVQIQVYDGGPAAPSD